MKIRRTDYKICEFCGASLDVGEKCDCIDKQLAKINFPIEIDFSQIDTQEKARATA